MSDAVIVYIITNEYLRDRNGQQVCKIGFTSGSTIPDLEKRLGQLYSTSLPEKFICNYAVIVEDKKVERLLHKKFMGYRINEGREFFTCGLNLVKNALLLSGARFLVNQDQDEQITEVQDGGQIMETQKTAEIRTKTPNQYAFQQLSIAVGSELVYTRNPNIKCITAHGRKVIFEGEEYSLSGLTKSLLEAEGKYGGVNGWMYFTFNGKTLYEFWKEKSPSC
jgi:hypothetical protein